MKEALSSVYYGLAILSVGGVLCKLLYSWFRDDQTSKRFICDMAIDHLPYIYRELRKLNPGAEEHPAIAFSHFKEN